MPAIERPHEEPVKAQETRGKSSFHLYRAPLSPSLLLRPSRKPSASYTAPYPPSPDMNGTGAGKAGVSISAPSVYVPACSLDPQDALGSLDPQGSKRDPQDSKRERTEDTTVRVSLMQHLKAREEPPYALCLMPYAVCLMPHAYTGISHGTPKAREEQKQNPDNKRRKEGLALNQPTHPLPL